MKAGSEMSPRTKVEIENNSHFLKEVSKDLINTLRAQDVSEEVIFDVHVGFEEALRNAMIHGNKNSPEKKVRVETEVTEDEVVIVVEDEGEGFDFSKVPDPTQEENLLKESGRGVYLIKHLMDQVTYDLGGRRVTMKKAFSKRT